jgi:hypothetical protein
MDLSLNFNKLPANVDYHARCPFSFVLAEQGAKVRSFPAKEAKMSGSESCGAKIYALILLGLKAYGSYALAKTKAIGRSHSLRGITFRIIE